MPQRLRCLEIAVEDNTVPCSLQKKLSEKKNFHMSPDAFRHHGIAVVDWIADYYEAIESFPVLSICLT